MELHKQKRAFDEELIEFNNGINYFTNNFRETPVYNKYADIIERAEPKKTTYYNGSLYSVIKERFAL